ncbi:hypothetical protein Glove_168g14 [Diversispora epigaea]|uniref:Uncharacterized protein n=1 Tax=Diversispora epigaea TaxID=1348612 RepID=A0A397ISM8_9GLOM|nr:hypothetical protein Glove_168g14 [Diversispora epigaea]
MKDDTRGYFIPETLVVFVPPQYNDRKVYKSLYPILRYIPKVLRIIVKVIHGFYLHFFEYFCGQVKMLLMIDISEMSPFLRVIHEEKGYEIYQTPTIMSALDFKWASARLLNIISFSIVIVTFNCRGDYAIKKKRTDLQNSDPVLAFTAFIMWIQLLCLSRYFECPDVLSISLKTLLYSDITINQIIDKSSQLDNYYSNFLSSVEAVFFWTNGRWDQLGQWNNLAVDFMTNKEGHIVAYRHHARLIAECEAAEKPFVNVRDNPRYIYYIPNPDIINTWLEETKKDEERLMDMNLAESSDIDYSDDGDDNDNDDNQELFSKKSQRNWKSNNKLLKNVSCNKSCNEPLFDPTNVDDQSMQERFNNLENEFKTRFNNQKIRFDKQETRFDELERNIKTILKTLKNLNNFKEGI